METAQGDIAGELASLKEVWGDKFPDELIVSYLKLCSPEDTFMILFQLSEKDDIPEEVV